MANQTLLTDNIADNVTFNIKLTRGKDNPGNPNDDPSVFNFSFGEDYYLSEFNIFDAYCIQPWMQ